MIKKGEKIPNETLYSIKNDTLIEFKSHNLLSYDRCIIFGVPGAFTKTCSKLHVPGFIEYKKKFTEFSIDFIGCIAVNDPYVVKAWSKIVDPEKSIEFISDGNCEFTQALGLTFDLSHLGMNLRSKRYSMLIDNLCVKHISVDDSGCSLSSAGQFYESITKLINN